MDISLALILLFAVLFMWWCTVTRPPVRMIVFGFGWVAIFVALWLAGHFAGPVAASYFAERVA